MADANRKNEPMGQLLRTPDQRFADLPGYAFRARYLDGLACCGDGRIHYLDEGPAQAARVYFCLHGQPTYAGLLVMNTAFATGDRPLGRGFLDWRDYSNRHPDLAVGKLLSRACPHLSAAEASAYDAPFPDATYKAGVRRFPNLVPDGPDADGAAVSRRARDWFRTRWQGQTFMAVGMRDPVLGPPVMADVASNIRNCPPPLEVADGGHFLPEWGEAVAVAALEAL